MAQSKKRSKNHSKNQSKKLSKPNPLLRFIVTLFATGLGSGYSPIAPGTMGSIVGGLIVFFLLPWSGFAKFIFWIILFFISIYVSHRFDQYSQSNDNQKIVIDEIMGMGIATALCTNWIGIILGFILFRLFDITKPPPVRFFDQMSKNSPGANGFGVVLDDVLAGILALICFYLINQLTLPIEL